MICAKLGKKFLIFTIYSIIAACGALCFFACKNSPDSSSDTRAVLKFESDTSFSITSANGTGGKTWDGMLEFAHEFPSDDWSIWTGNIISAKKGKNGKYLIYIRGLHNTVITGTNSDRTKRWKIDGSNISCSGDIRSLLHFRDMKKAEDNMQDNSFAYLFCDNSSLLTPPSLPIVYLTNYCYKAMFSDCTSLNEFPSLPAQTLKSGCYTEMFKNCSSIKFSKEKRPYEHYINKYRFAFGDNPPVDSYETMLDGTGGSFTGPIESNGIYYTLNKIVN